MRSLPVVSGPEAIRALERAGWERIRQRGSHAILVHRVLGRTIPVPVHGARDLTARTLRSIIGQAGLTVDEFTDLLH